MNRRLIRVIVALILLGLLFSYVGVADLMQVFLRLELSYIFYLLIIAVLLIWLSSLKWQLFLRGAGHEVSVLELMKYYTMSYFFSLFMPSLLGGDVARSIHLGSKLQSYKSVFAATFIERFTGLLAMTLIASAVVFFGAEATKGIEIAVYLISATCVLLAIALFSDWFGQRFFSGIQLLLIFVPQRFVGKTKNILDQVQGALAFSRNNHRLLCRALIYSLAFHFMAVINTYIAALAIGWSDASFTELCVVVPLVLLISVIPVTPSAIGIQEGAFFYFLSKIGASHAEALAVPLVIRAKNIITALVGAGIWFMSADRVTMNPLPAAGSDDLNDKNQKGALDAAEG